MTTSLTSVVDAVATRLNELGLGYWDTSSTYPKTPPRTPIYGKRYATGTPTAAIAVTAYNVTLPTNPDLHTETIRVQVRCRNVGNADLIADPIVNAIHGQHHQTWGPLTIQRCIHISTAQLGADTQNMDERTDNYELEILTNG